MIVEGYVSPLEEEIEKSCYSCKYCLYDDVRKVHFCFLEFESGDIVDNSDVVFPYMFCECFSPFIPEKKQV